MLQICCSKTVMAWMMVVAVVAMIKHILHSANFWSPSRSSMANMPQVNQPHFPHNLTHNLSLFPQVHFEAQPRWSSQAALRRWVRVVAVVVGAY